MIKRIVKMSFHPEKVPLFLEVYRNNWKHIRSFPGCNHVELLQAEGSLFFTYSIWDSEENIEEYRSSELFKGVWAATKVHFNDKPQAWSVRDVVFGQ